MLMLLHTFGNPIDPPAGSNSGFGGWEMAVLCACLVLLILQGAARG